ncbi:hypothetical protein TUM20983_26590 [Mycobacterium antarcticum]|uniref:hypothetical protein n=1 Tax=Mycolicibacterium sp. TUM20983 TaxID=3023369 RepID=UPI0023A23F11|nr:hypothetical protein [Mycolicibacterium sp. TUM20983]GLP75549.1 hypothetical protein TUM20983_26590 [Mycolicibacterium sp. TUM20983]
MYNLLQRRSWKQKKAMNAPHLNAPTTSPSGNGTASGPSADASITRRTRRDRTRTWKTLRHNDTGRLTSRWFVPFIQDPPSVPATPCHHI